MGERGGNKPNYDAVSVTIAEKSLEEAGMPVNIMIDCSHGNCMKDPELEPLVLKNCVDQILEGNRSIVGMMVESNLEWGNQPLIEDHSRMRYGVSITDPCIDWKTTETLLCEARNKLRNVLPGRR